MTYRFKPMDELLWGALIAAALVLLQALVTLNPETITDWQTWAVALGGGMVRAAAGAAIDYLRRSAVQQPDLPASPPIPSAIERTYSVIHRQCGRIAFLALVPPQVGEDLDTSEVRHLDGSRIVETDAVTCDTCGDRLGGVLSERGQWIAVSAIHMLGGN